MPSSLKEVDDPLKILIATGSVTLYNRYRGNEDIRIPDITARVISG
jgi:hypothetical protein